MKNEEEDIEEGIPHGDTGRKDKYRAAYFILYKFLYGHVRKAFTSTLYLPVYG